MFLLKMFWSFGNIMDLWENLKVLDSWKSSNVLFRPKVEENNSEYELFDNMISKIEI